MRLPCQLLLSLLLLISACGLPGQSNPPKPAPIPVPSPAPPPIQWVTPEIIKQLLALPEISFSKVHSKQALQDVNAAIFNVYYEDTYSVRFGKIDLQVLVLVYNNQAEHVVVEFNDPIVYNKVYQGLLVYYTFTGRVVILPYEKGGALYLREMRVALPDDL